MRGLWPCETDVPEFKQVRETHVQTHRDPVH